MTTMLKSVTSTVQLIENMTRREVPPLSMALTSQIYQILWDGQKKIWKTINKKKSFDRSDGKDYLFRL